MRRRKRSRGWWWVLFAIVVLVWWRCRRSDDPQLPPPPAPAPAPAPPPAPPPSVDAPARGPELDAAAPAPAFDAAAELAPDPASLPARPKLPYARLQLLRLSSDGEHALLYDPANGVDRAPQFRAVSVTTGALEADVEMPAFATPGIDEPQPPPDDAKLAADAARARELLRGFPLGNGDWMASSPDGTRGAVGIGDVPRLATGDKLGPLLRTPAAYDPMILADGTTLLVRAYDGEVDGPGTGKYSLFSTSLAGTGKLTKIAGTDALTGRWALSRDGSSLWMEVFGAPKYPLCLLEIVLAPGKPVHVAQKRCVENAIATYLSPTGERAAWFIPLAAPADDTFNKAHQANHRIRTMDLATGAFELDVVADGVATVSDGGRLVVDEFDGAYDDHGGDVGPLGVPTAWLADARFRAEDELVFSLDGSVYVIDLEKARTLGRTSTGSAVLPHGS